MEMTPAPPAASTAQHDTAAEPAPAALDHPPSRQSMDTTPASPADDSQAGLLTGPQSARQTSGTAAAEPSPDLAAAPFEQTAEQQTRHPPVGGPASGSQAEPSHARALSRQTEADGSLQHQGRQQDPPRATEAAAAAGGYQLLPVASSDTTQHISSFPEVII